MGRGLDERGLEYGTAFQTIRSLCRSQGEALGKLQHSEDRTEGIHDYQAHPALLDGCFQVLGAALMDGTGDAGPADIYLPIAIEKMSVYGPLIPPLWCHARIRNKKAAGSETIFSDLRVFNDDGDMAAEINGFIGIWKIA